KLAAGEPIFQLSSGVANLRISFADAAWEFLRLTIDDRRSEPVPLTGAQLHRPRSAAPAETLPITIKSRDDSLGITRLALDLGAAHLTVASLHIDTSGPLFTPTATLGVSEIGGDG